MRITDEPGYVPPSDLRVATWKRALAMASPVVGTVLGAAMAVQWALGGDEDFSQGPPGAVTIGRWMASNLPLMDDRGEPIWAWRGPFFLSVALILPVVWEVTGRVPSSAARSCTRGALLVATAAITLEYSTPGYGWLFDLAALLVAIAGTAGCGVSALRRRRLPSGISWSLIAVLPLTPLAGFLTFWYMPPGLTMGLLLSWALAAVFAGGRPPH
jgi:hypothetical protein